jgi:hypothetical protein
MSRDTKAHLAGFGVALIALAFCAAGAYAAVLSLSGLSAVTVILYVVVGYLIVAVGAGGVVWGFHRAARQKILLRQQQAAYEVQHRYRPSI